MQGNLFLHEPRLGSSPLGTLTKPKRKFLAKFPLAESHEVDSSKAQKLRGKFCFMDADIEG